MCRHRILYPLQIGPPFPNDDRTQWRLQEFCPGCSHSTLKKFRVFWDVSVNTGRNSRFGRNEVCNLKKKMFLKPKQICILYTEKPQKEKKWKKNEMNKGTCTINYKFIWNINKIINYCCLVVSLICLHFINYNLLYCCFINYKIINCYLA